MKTKLIYTLILLCFVSLCNINAYAQSVVIAKENINVPDNVCNSSSYNYIATVSGVSGIYTLSFAPTNGTVVSTTVSGNKTTANIKWIATTATDGYKGQIKADLLVGSSHYYSNVIPVTIKSIKDQTATLIGVPSGSPWNLSPCETGTLNLEAGNMYVPGTGDVFPEKVNAYAWLVPKGWTVNGWTSPDGTTWKTTGQNVTVTYPQSNAGGSIKVKASYLTACGDLQESKESPAITVNRDVNFTLTASSAYILCGDVNPVTFTVSPALPCATYYWNNSQTATTNNTFQITPNGSSDIIATVYIVYGTANTTKQMTLKYSNFAPGVVPAIVGSANLCSGTYSYSVSDLRPGYTVNWTISSKLQQVSIVGNTLTVGFNSAGSAVIGASVSSNCNIPPTVISKTVWIGTPIINPVNPLAYFNDDNIYNNVCNSQSTTINMSVYGTPTVTWSKIGGTPSYINWNQSGNDLSFYFYNLNQTAIFKVTGSNGCGATVHNFAFKSIDCSGGGGGGCDITYAVSPNPASTTAIITPSIPAPCDNAISLQSETVNGTITLYDSQGVAKKRKTYKTMTATEFDISDLKNGSYFIEINDGTKSCKKTLIVQH